MLSRFKKDKMVSCGVPGCKNRANKTSNKSFHRLPPKSKPELRKNWCVKLKRQTIPDVLSVCSDHFEPECFKRDLKVWIFGLNLYRSSHQRCSIEIVVLKNFTKFTQEITCVEVPFLTKLQAWALFSCKFCETFKNTFFTEHFWAAASAYRNCGRW